MKLKGYTGYNLTAVFVKLYSAMLANNDILAVVQFISIQKFCLDIRHEVTNIGKSWCVGVVSQTPGA